jgi:capsular polysaccharide biosynthesis protein
VLYNTPVDLKDILKFTKKNAIKITAVGLFFGLLGVAVYYWVPTKYLASGSIYVKRSVENGEGKYFTYEGYYNQQTATSYTNTVMGFLESIDVRSQSLENLGFDVTESSLRRLGKQIKIKKAGNQLITLSVKDISPQYAQALWLELARNTISTAQTLNSNSDPALQISMLKDLPVVKEVYKNVWLNFFIGVALGKLIAIIVLAFKAYVREQR